jgi:poly(A) polymerase Pap1
VYENYQVDHSKLEEGFLKSKLLVLVSGLTLLDIILIFIVALQAFKAIFTSPSSAREAEGDGDGADIIENNRRARRKSDHTKVKTCVASIINMKKVTPRAIAYIVCQVSKGYVIDRDIGI